MPLHNNPNLFNDYTHHNFFEKQWYNQNPTLIIGNPDIKTCGTHRIEVIIENYDFIACNFIEDNDIFLSLFNYPLNQKLIQFFNILFFFKNTIKNNIFGIFDFMIDNNKIIKINRRYISSLEEYKNYIKKNEELNLKLTEKRNHHLNCFWCFQSFVGLTIHGIQKGILYTHENHIPKAMNNVLANYKLLKNISIEDITKSIANYFNNPEIKDIFKIYNKFINEIISTLNKNDINFIIKFQIKLHENNMKIIKIYNFK